MSRAWSRVLIGIVLILIVLPFAAAPRAQSGVGADLSTWLQRVGESVERYFSRAQSLMCIEDVSLQTLSHDLSPDRSPLRRLQYEFRVAWEPSPDGATPEATSQRQLLKIGSRAAKASDKPGCMDPKEATPEPLSILLPENQKDASFTLGGRTKVNGRNAVTLNYRSLETGPITSKMTGPDCWSAELPGRARGRFWIDEETNDVLRHDTWLTGIFDINLPRTREYPNPSTMTIERLDSSTVYRRVSFRDPEETIMLPRSVDLLQVVRNAGNVRIRHTFSNYRRFITGGRIVEE